ncbi:MAG: S8 family serine peptidase, partial [Deinococcota bacterium]|nr:S8 family serine peptidase [Deinococcota bacterium]
TPTDADPGFGEPANFHGTHVAGIIGATGNNGLGVAGVVHDASVRLLPVKIFNDSGGGATTSTFVDGIRWAAGLPVTTSDAKRVKNPNPARIINLSLGGDISSRAMQEAIDAARAQGATVIAATGNNGFERVLSPAAANGVIGVGSHNQLFGRSCFSNYGTGPNGPGGVDIVAPGGEGNGTAVSCGLLGAQRQAILSTVPESSYSFSAGTSMAAPMVAGVAALILSRQPELSAAALEERLLTTGYFDPDAMNAEEYGAGVLRADRALGLPGPGDPVALYALGPEGPGEGRSEGTGLAVLDLYGGSSPYRVGGLSSGSYTVRAGAHGPGGLYGERSVLVRDDTSQEQLTIRLEHR